MANNLGSLVVSLGLDASEFTSGLSKGEYQAKRVAQNITADFAALTKFVAGLGIGAAFVEGIRNATDYADAISKMSQKVGIGTEELSRLTYAAGLSDVSNEQLSKGLRELSNDVGNGGKKLAEFGISLTDASGQARTADQLFAVVADRFAGMPDGIEKTAAAAALFGDRIGPELIPLLNAGAVGLQSMGDEAQRFGRVVREDAAKAAEEFNDNLTRLDARISGLSLSLAGPIVSGINGLIDRFNEGSKAGQGFIETLLKQTETARLLGLAETRNPYSEARQELERVNKALESGKLNAMQTTAFLQKQSELAKVISETLTGRRLNSADPRIISGPGAFGELPQAPKAPAVATLGAQKPRSATDPDAAFERYVSNLQRQIDAASKMTVVETTLRDIQLGRAGVVSEAQRTELLNLARISDQIGENEKTMRRFAEAEREAEQTRKQLAAAGLQVWMETRTEQERLIERLAEIDRLQQAGAISAETAGRAAAKAYGEAEAAAKRLSEEQKTAKQLAGQFQSAFASTATDIIFNSASASDAVRALGIEIAKIIIQRELITPFAEGAGKLLSSWLTGVSFDGGGYTGTGARSGGVDGKGGFPAILHPNETVIDHTKGQGLGGVTVVQTFNISSNADPQAVMMLRSEARRIKEETIAAVSERASRGGSFARSVGRV